MVAFSFAMTCASVTAAATCSELDGTIEAKVSRMSAALETGAYDSMCAALTEHVTLLEEMIAFHEQCGAEMDPTGAQLAEYRKVMPESIAARDQLCGN